MLIFVFGVEGCRDCADPRVVTFSRDSASYPGWLEAVDLVQDTARCLVLIGRAPACEELLPRAPLLAGEPISVTHPDD